MKPGRPKAKHARSVSIQFRLTTAQASILAKRLPKGGSLSIRIRRSLTM